MSNIHRTFRRLLAGLVVGGVIHFALPFALSAQEPGAGAPSGGTIGVGATVVEAAPLQAVASVQQSLVAQVREAHAEPEGWRPGVILAPWVAHLIHTDQDAGAVVGWVEGRGAATVIWVGDLGH